MTDACQANEDKAQSYLERFRGQTLGHLIGGESVSSDGSNAMDNHAPIDGSLLNHIAQHFSQILVPIHLHHHQTQVNLR